MIEITKVEPKQIQRKLLTAEQEKAICDKHTTSLHLHRCYNCPLCFSAEKNGIGMDFSCNQAMAIEQALKDYWNEEIEVDV